MNPLTSIWPAAFKKVQLAILLLKISNFLSFLTMSMRSYNLAEMLVLKLLSKCRKISPRHIHRYILFDV